MIFDLNNERKDFSPPWDLINGKWNSKWFLFLYRLKKYVLVHVLYSIYLFTVLQVSEPIGESLYEIKINSEPHDTVQYSTVYSTVYIIYT